jgi:hypothetical protein
MSVRAELEAAIAEAREMGFRVWEDGDEERDNQGRARCEVGRYLDDGVFYVGLFGGQSDAEKLTILHLALRRLLRFDSEKWTVRLGEASLPPVAYTWLCDYRGTPAELLRDSRRTMAAR